MPAARPQRIGSADRSYVEDGVGNIGWRDIDLVTADLGNAIDLRIGRRQTCRRSPTAPAFGNQHRQVRDRDEAGESKRLPSCDRATAGYRQGYSVYACQAVSVLSVSKSRAQTTSVPPSVRTSKNVLT
jgi:hypothetical protein